jgi:hypothetical protein
MSFHAPGIDYDEGQKAWTAWRSAGDAAQLTSRGSYDSMVGLISRNMKSVLALGIAWQQLRQDESVSWECADDGLRVWLGEVEGTEQISDEGQLLTGRRDSWEAILIKGGFAPDEAADYLDRLAKTSSSFAAEVPAGSDYRLMLDPETLYAFHMDGDDTIRDVPRKEAITIFAAGTFPMPGMVSHQKRQATSEAQPGFLVLVHPGSLFGSADSLLGRSEAQGVREDVFGTLDAHVGPVLIIDGALSDEIGSPYENRIEAALSRAMAAGHQALRLWGCDSGEAPFGRWSGSAPDGVALVHDSQQEAARAAAQVLAGHQVAVTGAWASVSGTTGCVNSVADVLREALGPAARIGIDDSAAIVPEEFDDSPEP